MKVMAAGQAKNSFGLLIDTARSEPVTIKKHGRPVAVVLSVEEYERLSTSVDGHPSESRESQLGDAADRQLASSASSRLTGTGTTEGRPP